MSRQSGGRKILGLVVAVLLAGLCAGNGNAQTAKVPVASAGKFPDPMLKSDQVIKATPGTATYTSSKGKYDSGHFAVYIPPQYSPAKPMPLVVSSHGSGGTGPKEIGGWVKFADKYGFIVVCPSYGCATFSGSAMTLPEVIGQDDKSLREIMERVLKSLNIDRAHVLHTGFSGGGVPTWYIAMSHPEWFTALCFRSANFYGTEVVHVAKKQDWKSRPIFTFWGTKDNPIILDKSPVLSGGEGPAGLEFLKRMHCDKLKHEILPGGGHDGRIDLAAQWFGEEVVGKN